MLGVTVPISATKAPTAIANELLDIFDSPLVSCAERIRAESRLHGNQAFAPSNCSHSLGEMRRLEPGEEILRYHACRERMTPDFEGFIATIRTLQRSNPSDQPQPNLR